MYLATCWRLKQYDLTGIHHFYQLLNKCCWLQCSEWQRPWRLSFMRWHMESISNSSTCFTTNVEISPAMIWTAVFTRQKAHGISTVYCKTPQHPELNHQKMVNSYTVHRVLGFLMRPIDTRLKTVCSGKLWWKQNLDSNFKSQLRQDSIQCITGVIRRCCCFQVRLMIQGMIP